MKRYMVQVTTGRRYPYDPVAAKRKDMKVEIEIEDDGDVSMVTVETPESAAKPSKQELDMERLRRDLAEMNAKKIPDYLKQTYGIDVQMGLKERMIEDAVTMLRALAAQE